MSRFSHDAVYRQPGHPPRTFALTATDSTVDLRGWIELGSPWPLRSSAWLRDSVVTVAISRVPCEAVFPEVCVEFAMLTEYAYGVSLSALPATARRLEVRHEASGAGSPGTLVFAAHLGR